MWRWLASPIICLLLVSSAKADWILVPPLHVADSILGEEYFEDAQITHNSTSTADTVNYGAGETVNVGFFNPGSKQQRMYGKINFSETVPSTASITRFLYLIRLSASVIVEDTLYLWRNNAPANEGTGTSVSGATLGAQNGITWTKRLNFTLSSETDSLFDIAGASSADSTAVDVTNFAAMLLPARNYLLGTQADTTKDRGRFAIDTTRVAASQSGWVTFDLTYLAQQWQAYRKNTANGFPNNGFFITAHHEADAVNGKGAVFISRENASSALEPRAVVDWQDIQVPGAIGPSVKGIR